MPSYQMVMILQTFRAGLEKDISQRKGFYSSHHCVGLLFFAWIPKIPPATVRSRRAAYLSHTTHHYTTSHISHHCTTYLSHSSHISLSHLTSLRPLSHLTYHYSSCNTHQTTLITAPLKDLSISLITYQLILQHSSHTTHHCTTYPAPLILQHSPHTTHHCTTYHISLITSYHLCGQAQYTAPPGGAAARLAPAGPDRRGTQSLLDELRRDAAGPRLPVVRQAHTQSLLWRSCGAPAVGAAAPHRAFWWSCSARGRRWPAAAFRVWHAQYTEPSGGAAAYVGAAGPRLAACRVAGAVHRAFWWSCGARGRRWPAAAFRVAGAEPSGGGAARVVAAGPRLAFRVAGAAVHRAFWCARGRRWPAAAFRVAGAVHRASWRVSGLALTPSLTHHLCHTTLSHTIFYTPSLTPSLTHHLFVTPSFTHHVSHTTLSHTIFHTQLCHTQSFTHNFVTHHLSHTNFVTHHLSHTKFVTHHLLHTIFHTPSFTQHLSHTALSNTIFHTPSLTPHL